MSSWVIQDSCVVSLKTTKMLHGLVNYPAVLVSDLRVNFRLKIFKCMIVHYCSQTLPSLDHIMIMWLTSASIVHIIYFGCSGICSEPCLFSWAIHFLIYMYNLWIHQSDQLQFPFIQNVEAASDHYCQIQLMLPQASSLSGCIFLPIANYNAALETVFSQGYVT